MTVDCVHEKKKYFVFMEKKYIYIFNVETIPSNSTVVEVYSFMLKPMFNNNCTMIAPINGRTNELSLLHQRRCCKPCTCLLWNVPNDNEDT
mmetsp:Transcript_106366/g.216921  ORF Transcript_106366/g.216921 Transcript_106366/m.216921 type:complete len:91 (-) Transcript_106366:308-580(-)